ncbi:hypothetical protein NVP1152O_052 [Vibrio phage 1.152.O._10N.222.46.E1]|uniref:Uncharacterized protein n=5 Tax=Nahantvirus 49C7 TaxID=2846601 RepID=A0A2I7RBE4_9CAUD|nr:hypothetical protein HYP57_gp051 [Vibrio phage 1.026.O._10N.222.49.C7]AUR82534.1 hypothetical protein NVP1025O_051 [Vibrio phage 1.025.O._10N.222.46.B6]AUR90784.1 hypothetical protein NVP1150O_051 [Vibrio phage 1.150.O._10N.222.46.A6]AUR90957.1 hypothetical protein NVP1152O_052 [Vibrio phage 1.152.O._10N.222.46.E1]AUS02425.1 hypothetical protein NVP2130O_051 [Vibrio phage 2.130.O._10N.222.46.C2]AUR82642.1 hypothetical protein NVP1026O_051 [Vibrio phage 1.026.O._10N.222.49.C7]
MWRILSSTNKYGTVYMARKGDMYIKFTVDRSSYLNSERLLEPTGKNIRMTLDPNRWEEVIAPNWEHTGYYGETLRDIYEQAHLLHLLED